jgi:transposase
LTEGPGNRQQRRELERRLNSADPGLGVVHGDAAGIDIGNASHFAAVPPDRDEQPVREFGSWTGGLREMASWLKQCGIRTVAMQSTGVYWIAAQEVLEGEGLEVYLVNARGTKNLPGRKSDVQESEWLRKLHTYGLLRNSFRPPEQIRTVRTIWRQRDRLVQEAGRTVQQMQKALTTMNVQLANTISDVSGVTGMAIIRALLAGERDGRKLAKLRDGRICASEEEIAQSLEGNWREDVLFELRQVVEAYDFYQKQREACDRELQKYMAALPDHLQAGEPVEPHGKSKSRRKNDPGFDLAAELQRILGADVTCIDGVNMLAKPQCLSQRKPLRCLAPAGAAPRHQRR